MTERKLRILLCNEASFLSTGFSTYGLEVLKRLHATNKYELAELASYGGANFQGENRWKDLPWKYYPNLPQSEEEIAVFNSKTTNVFGEWKFEQTCLDFKPDIVWSWRDIWMDEHIQRSPFRKFYHWAFMPTVDAAPQDEQWIATILSADGVFTYSEFGKKTLEAEGVHVVDVASPGADLSAYKVPQNKRSHKEAMGLQADTFIVGTVMRNQLRKLYPDLIQAFRLFLDTAPRKLAEKTYLYIHCAFPDIGWDLPKLIREAGITSRTLFTYFCRSCGFVFPAFYQDARSVCLRCGKHTATLPKSQLGIKNDTLGSILGTFDAYVQYATSEGFGMPQVEAAACGLPVFAVDYSAMSNVCRRVGGYPIKVERMFRDRDTHCLRALPDNKDLVTKLVQYLSLPESLRLTHAYKARKAVEDFYNWDKTALTWEKYFDSLQLVNKWAAPPDFHNYHNVREPNGLSNEQFVKWGLVHIANRPDLLNSYTAMRMLRDLNWSVTQEGAGGVYFNEASTLSTKLVNKEFTRKHAIEELKKLCDQKNFWEQQRTAAP